MKESLIFRNIQHVPRIWGVTYLKLFPTLGGGLLVTTLGFILTPAESAAVKLMMLGLGVVATLALYGVSLWIDNSDPLERDSAPFIRREMNSQSLSLQKLRILDREAS